MNVRMAKNFEFSAMVVSSLYTTPVINHYSVAVKMLSNCDDGADINTAYYRMSYWISEVLQNSVLISQDSKELSIWDSTKLKTLLIPEDPVDQLVGIMLYCKLNAIAQGRVIVQEVAVSSMLDDHVVYLHDEDESLGPLVSAGWWNDPSPTWVGTKTRSKAGKVISITRPVEWKDLELDWSDSEQTCRHSIFRSTRIDVHLIQGTPRRDLRGWT